MATYSPDCWIASVMVDESSQSLVGSLDIVEQFAIDS
eukprot:CAMPEP_0116882230 /NCGR_PEP_ID=MMETSP0463-20121206/14431_1 /TAXON_ID=181622 /ORGANISM="Strombidinopsis sp, Strain SopsisLIS2011" /LENGTH=36 /DNA_ID= /DNA_START= /DNA_END= /DNA_ORIENTATION=